MLLKHGAIYLAAKLLPALITLATMAVFTRLLKPEEYGTYSLTILAAGMINAIFLQWVTLGVGRYLSECKNDIEANKLLGTARIVALSVSMLGVLFSFVAWIFQDLISFSIIYYMVGFICAAQACYDLNLIVHNANLHPINYGKLLVSKSIMGFGIGTSAILLGYGAEGAVIAITLALLFSSFWSRKTWSGIRWLSFDERQLSRLFDYGAPLTITFLLIFIIDASDRFFIDKMIGVHAVGIYSAAYEITQYSIVTLASVVHLTAFPLLINEFSKNGEAAARVQLGKTFLFILAVAAPTTAGLAAISSSIAHSLMGASFSEEAAKIIPLVSIAMFLGALKSFYFDYAFQLSKSTGTQVITVAVAAAVNLIGNFFCIPRYGTFGAAIATVLAFGAALFMSFILGRKVFNMPKLPWKDSLKIVLSTVLMLTVINFLEFKIPVIDSTIKIIVGACVYSVSLLATNFFNSRQGVVRIFSKIEHSR